MPGRASLRWILMAEAAKAPRQRTLDLACPDDSDFHISSL